jgi:2-hydroxychromene-2-carboxylate isomerase
MGSPAKSPDEWAERASRYLKAALKHHGKTYDDLAEDLKKHGFKDETKASIANKLARGTFPAPFFLAALVAIGAETIRLEDI